jgi:capsular polysaccharide export protein
LDKKKLVKTSPHHTPASNMRRSFLFLQGPASPFFARLSHSLAERGHGTLRVNFCGGDRLFKGRTPSVDYTGITADLGAWYERLFKEVQATDVVLFGDCRPVHKPVHDIAQNQKVNVHVMEEGYVRPDWFTLERFGVNGRSRMPRDSGWFVDQHKADPVGTKALDTGYSLRERAVHDMRYRAANALYARSFPTYESHRPKNGFTEYQGLASRFARQSVFRRQADRVLEELAGKKRFFLFPLQLSSDSQIVVHSPFVDVRQAIDTVIKSFSQFADSETLLVIKNHPLDTGLIDYKNHAFSLARSYGTEARLRFVDSGHLPTFLTHADGVVVVNSTVGLSALHHGCPVIVLGTAIYDLHRLTWQGSLDEFWKGASTPDMKVYWALLDYIIKHTQINGNFYTRKGIDMAIPACIERLELDHV